ncbi:MAG: DUF4301 family protein [Bacteroidota bacterium]
MFTDQDLQQIQARGSDLSNVTTQIANFESGFPFLPVDRAATVGDGIIRLKEEEVKQYVAAFEAAMDDKKVLKFVPASGAASRMFKALFAYLSDYQGTEEEVAALNSEDGPLGAFFSRLTDFAFFQDLVASIGGTETFEALSATEKPQAVLSHLLTEAGLGYGSLPKGLLKFHKYEAGARTPLEEHLVEAASYAAKSGGTAYLHFTVSPEHQEKFEAQLGAVKAHYEEKFGVKLDVSFSIQKPSTDTIAVDMENAPFREEDGTILFRPGGHGALIENLNDLDADIMFIKNIDNVVPDRIKAPTVEYKKALAGVLLFFQEKVFEYLGQLEAETEEDLLDEMLAFLESALCVEAPEGHENWDADQKVAYLKAKFNRPFRVCGMVKNEGEPGGGPFWAKNSDGSISLQIAESAQIDKENAAQFAIMQGASHFNPVDLICATRDKEGTPFDLLPHRDPQTGFISFKSKNGRELKAQELPGLWNGAMSDWNTLFVEVPIITFNPVKTVNDLLRDQHQ